jgi:hypothetical protein
MSEQVKECMDLEHCMYWLHLEPTHLRLPLAVAHQSSCGLSVRYRVEHGATRDLVGRIRRIY